MNANMWNHPATQQNLRLLAARGHRIVMPEQGPLACGMVGPGRLADPQKIAAEVLESLQPLIKDLDGETVLITAGPTQEALDPVRYITNRSSGKMGYALAEAAVKRGASVTLVSGPVQIDPPAGVNLIRIVSARQMRDAVIQHMDAATIIIKAAAVADYHLEEVPKQKVKKAPMRLSLELAPTPDILAEVGRRKGDRLLVGFAAETDNLMAEARRKLETKHCDMVVGNLVNQDGTGFESDENEVVLVLNSGESIKLPRARKTEIAHKILDQVMRLRLALHSA
jgi:phosphopantothenoylcysteine decarboxylase/phosphopantothenate--cysteine ligase